jgi:succinyl-diaminopimelate desuccinylase
MKEILEAWVDAHRDEILAETQAVLRVPSVEEKATVGPDAPFGRPIADALEHTLALCERLGMRTQNFGGYAGHAEFGQGEEIIAMLGHLDVVPVGADWTKDPWGAEIEDGWLYGRGSADDKGPTYAALFGAKAVLDACAAQGITLSRRIRLIFGCDEESGWQCMAHYFGPAGQPKPTYAFTPDATFPVVFAEKGSFTAILEKRVEPGVLSDFRSGLRPNMVPDEAEAVLSLDPTAMATLGVTEGVSVSPAEGGSRAFARGKSAHGARPFVGVNAAMKLMGALAECDGVPAGEAEWLRDLTARGATDGSGVGIAGKDEITTPLTCNLGLVRYAREEGAVRATFNVRYPAQWDGDDTLKRFADSVATTGWTVAELSHTPALYVPPDAEPVQTLLRVYREHTGDPQPPRTMGGRTYATTVAPVGVAFGAALPDDREVAHQADERFPVDRLILAAKIYAHALYELAK